MNIQPFHLVLVLLFFLTQFPALSRCCHEDERNALLSFKSVLRDPSNRLSSWQVGQNCCNWKGIHCSDDSFHVVSLDLRNTNLEINLIKQAEDYNSTYDPFTPSTALNSLNGEIPPSLFDLTHLEYIDLSFNEFGFIPYGFGNLKKLTHLDLSACQLSGSITTQFANLSSIQYLDVSSVIKITTYRSSSYFHFCRGCLASTSMNWLRGLVNLKVLRLNGVHLFVSSINKNWAEPISYLADLEELHLIDCGISGPNPINEFLNLTRLSSLKMNSNKNLKYSPIPVQLANLTSLSVLDLSDCNLHGSIPHLPQLQELYVHGNRDLVVDLTWMFEHCPKLHALSIGDTQVIQSIPSSVSNTSSSLINLWASHCSIQGSFNYLISKLSQLQFLDLSRNNITGYIPSSISNLSQLQFLDISQNNIKGYLPSSISNLSQLRYLDLSFNNITGYLPSSIAYLKNLTYLSLGRNNFQGPIPESLICEISGLEQIDFSGNRLPSCIRKFRGVEVKSLILSACNLKGSIPNFICNLTHLNRLDLSYNNLKGAIPACLFELQSLDYIDLSQDNLQGTLPHSFRNFNRHLNLSSNNLQGPVPLPPKTVEVFDLSQNKFTGGISIETGERLSNSRTVSLSANKLSGSIPSSICPLMGNSLETLDLSNNQLTGTIPSSLGNCTSLRYLNLGLNNLTGNVPIELQATSLVYLQLNDNTFNGTFPHAIRKFQFLVVLNVGSNDFRGGIPSFIGSLVNLKILSLRSNKFNGTIPEEISNLQELQILDLSRNNFSGTIPRNIGNLILLQSRLNDTLNIGWSIGSYILNVQLQMVIKGNLIRFERLYGYNSGIDLSHNSLEGNIPKEMGLLKGLVMLSLSHNHFSGKIPVSVGSMTNLESLDLSFNRFSGDIPQSLTSMDSLGYLNLSYNNLSGKIPRGLHFETLSVDGSAYIGNPLLCGFPTEKRCEGDPVPRGSTDVPTSIPKDDEDDQEDAKEKWLFYGVVILGHWVGFWGLFFVLLLRREKWWFGYWRVVDVIAVRILECLS